MTDRAKYRNVSLSYSTHETLSKLSRELIKPATLSISKTVEMIVLERDQVLTNKQRGVKKND
jgi:hypothetical protein